MFKRMIFGGKRTPHGIFKPRLTPEEREALRERGRRRRFRMLQASLLVALSLLPAFYLDMFGTMVVLTLIAVLVVSTLYATTRDYRLFVTGAVLAGVSLTFNWLVFFVPSTLMETLCFGSGAVFYLFVTLNILFHVARQETITADIVSGGICTYLLTGVVWTWIYSLIDTLQPGSFASSHTEAPGELPWHELLYFSYVTLTTLGYGDITPVSKAARSFSVLEAIAGTLLVAVLISRVVGQYVSHSMEQQEAKKEAADLPGGE